MTEPIEQLHVTTIEIDGRSLNVSLAVEFDGVEHLGHLWFADEAWEDDGIRDNGTINGSSAEDVLAHARQLSADDLILRFHRAQSEKRRCHGLRRATEEVLSNIRYLHKVATSMRAGLLDVEQAAAEIDETEQKLHSIVGQLRHYAGVVG